MSKKIEGIGAAEVMKNFLWPRKKQLKLHLTNENKIEIEQNSIMDLIMDFQKWQIGKINTDDVC
jgi:hypothetical protein